MQSNLSLGSAISISMDNIWAGSGNLTVDGVIVNCGAQFCADNDESLKVYDRIEAAIAAGKSEITVTLDGSDRLISWHITPADR